MTGGPVSNFSTSLLLGPNEKYQNELGPETRFWTLTNYLVMKCGFLLAGIATKSAVEVATQPPK